MKIMLKHFEKEPGLFGLYIHAKNYKQVKQSMMSYSQVKDLIDKKKRSRKKQ